MNTRMPPAFTSPRMYIVDVVDGMSAVQKAIVHDPAKLVAQPVLT